MPHLFDLPIELLTLTLGFLDLGDLLRFCAICKSIRQAFRPQLLIWLVRNYDIGHGGDGVETEPSPALVAAVKRSSYLLLCHTFLELFRRLGEHGNYTLLLKQGASFRSIAHGKVLEDYFHTFGPGVKVDFLLKHGASFDQVSGGANRLLEDALRSQNNNGATFLIRHGASMQQLPSGPKRLLEDIFSRTQQPIPWLHVLSILEKSTPLYHLPRGMENWLRWHFTGDKIDSLLPYLPNGLNVMLTVALCKYGLGQEVDELLLRGASFDEIDPVDNISHDASGIVQAIRNRNIDARWDNLGSPPQIGRPPLIRAVIAGHMTAVTFLLNSGADIEVKWESNTPLSYAVLRNHLDIAMLLLEHGASISGSITFNWFGRTNDPLLCDASRRGQWEMVLLLLRHAADPDVVTSSGNTSLHLAAERNHSKVVQILLDHGACSRIGNEDQFYPLTLAATKKWCLETVRALAIGHEVNIWDEGGRTALTAASGQGNMDVVRLLLDQGADPALADTGRRSSLFAAASNGHLDIALLLISLGTDIDATAMGKTPLYAAARGGHSLIVEALVRKGADMTAADRNGLTPLGAAIEGMHLATVRILVDATTDFEARDADGRTPLLIAAASDFLTVCKLLIKRGADPGSATSDGDTALHIAVTKGFVGTGMALCKHVAVNQPNKDGYTPIHLAARNGSLDLVRAFVERGRVADASVDHLDSPMTPSVRRCQKKTAHSTLQTIDCLEDYGCTPLFAAAEKGHIHVVQYLTDQGADANIQNQQGRTSLFEAVEGKHIGAVKLLISRGAQVQAIDRNSQTPLHLAALNGSTEITAMLLDAGAKQMGNKDGEMPLHLAAKAGSTAVAALLIKSGADTNAQANDGNAPLHLATKFPELIRQLVHSGTAVDLVNAKNQTPLLNAVQFSHPQAALSLLAAGANPNHSADSTTPFLIVVQSGHLEVMCAMYQHGADVNVCDQELCTPLHHVASEGWLELASFLLCWGADPWAQDKDGRLPWECAFDHGHIELAVLIQPEDRLQEYTGRL